MVVKGSEVGRPTVVAAAQVNTEGLCARLNYPVLEAVNMLLAGGVVRQAWVLQHPHADLALACGFYMC